MPYLTAGVLSQMLGAKADWSARETVIEDLAALEVSDPAPEGDLIDDAALATALEDYTPTDGLAAALSGSFEPLVSPEEVPAVYDLEDVVTALVTLGFITVAAP